jgi:hypothetical protein
MMYSSTLSLTLALDWVGCERHATLSPGRFTTHGNDPVTVVWEVGTAPGPVRTCAKK